MSIKHKQWTLDYQRNLAIGSTRSYLRQMSIDPMGISAKEAIKALDDLCRILPADNYTCIWYNRAKDYQIKKFMREWEKWKMSRENS